MSNDTIPFLDLITVHHQLQGELVDVLKTALKSAAFIGGPMVQGFEEEFARFCEAQFCVGLGSGTDALRFALIAVGVKCGDIVITVPNTFIATTEAISQAGARPDFVDVDSKTYTMDSDQLREYLERKCRWNPKTRQVSHNATGRPITAIVPVHLYGQMADMDP
ncbi:MAG: aminotransferase class I/II-fold pyridoxal phosphate-dependent enzyme, partial [Nitrospira sp.]|nr:aminotransferase class I/II-fold pyridoxal phosphate-dependent enzyme [Nitrospira sp.]